MPSPSKPKPTERSSSLETTTKSTEKSSSLKTKQKKLIDMMDIKVWNKDTYGTTAHVTNAQTSKKINLDLVNNILKEIKSNKTIEYISKLTPEGIHELYDEETLGHIHTILTMNSNTFEDNINTFTTKLHNQLNVTSGGDLFAKIKNFRTVNPQSTKRTAKPMNITPKKIVDCIKNALKSVATGVVSVGNAIDQMVVMGYDKLVKKPLIYTRAKMVVFQSIGHYIYNILLCGFLLNDQLIDNILVRMMNIPLINILVVLPYLITSVSVDVLCTNNVENVKGFYYYMSNKYPVNKEPHKLILLLCIKSVVLNIRQKFNQVSSSKSKILEQRKEFIRNININSLDEILNKMYSKPTEKEVTVETIVKRFNDQQIILGEPVISQNDENNYIIIKFNNEIIECMRFLNDPTRDPNEVFECLKKIESMKYINDNTRVIIKNTIYQIERSRFVENIIQWTERTEHPPDNEVFDATIERINNIINSDYLTPQQVSEFQDMMMELMAMKHGIDIKSEDSQSSQLSLPSPNSRKSLPSHTMDPIREKILKDLEKTCIDMSDIFTQTDFADMKTDKLKLVVKIGEKTREGKQRCYYVKKLYKYIMSLANDKKELIDPYRMKLSDEDIENVIAKMRYIKQYVLDPRRKYPSIKLKIDKITDNNKGYFAISLVRKIGLRVAYKRLIGYIPDGNETNVTKLLSSTVIERINDLFNAGRLFDNRMVLLVRIDKDINYWSSDLISKLSGMLLRLQ